MAPSLGYVCDGLTGFDITGELSNVRKATLFIAGERDGMSPPQVSRHLPQAVPDTRLGELSGASHLSNVEAESFNDALLRFFGGRIAARQSFTAAFCLFAETITDPKGRQHKRYPYQWMELPASKQRLSPRISPRISGQWQWIDIRDNDQANPNRKRPHNLRAHNELEKPERRTSRTLTVTSTESG